MAVLGGEHARVLVAELIGDLFERDACIGHDSGSAMPEAVGRPACADHAQVNLPELLGAHTWGVSVSAVTLAVRESRLRSC